MIPERFEYFAPEKMEEALSLLQTYGDEARLLAGGLSIIPMMKLRLASPKYLIDINRIADLSYIRRKGDRLLIGALTRHRDLQQSDKVEKNIPILAETARVIGDPQVRNRGTIGGSLAHADPATDYGATLLALDAEVVVLGPRGRRTIPISEFFVDMYTTALEDDEILEEVKIAMPPQGTGSSYLKFERVAGDFATVGAAALLTLDGKRRCVKAGVGLAAAAVKPLRASRAEKILEGEVVDDLLIEKAAQKAVEASDPIPDLRGSVEYKQAMIGVFVERSLKLALSRAGGDE